MPANARDHAAVNLRPTALVPAVPVLALLFATAASAQHEVAPKKPGDPMYEAPASDEAKAQVATFELAPGLVGDLVAAEPDLCNVVAFSIDGQGRVYVAETFRIQDGVFDTRSYMQWKDDDLACTTVADRMAKYQKHIAKDIPKYSAYSERVRMLVDTDKNGTFDRSTVFAEGFADLADGIGSGVLPVGGDVYFTNIPKLWRLRDTNGDGVADERTALHDGYGVHTSLIGHDLHGLIVGPDRRLYFSIGDRGFHVEQDGHTLAYPHEGAVLRCELDGSDLEVVHHGLRNPQELAFDQWGDLFTGDNNSDGGDRARFVQIVPGADSGWRIGFQWLDDRGAWNREKMWQPRHLGQSAGIQPPIVNFADGPSGLAYDPGQGLPDRFRDCFFLCDFRGGKTYSGVHALRVVRAGAGFELLSTEHVVWSILATDVDFGPDGSLYVSDWVEGWNKTGKGRLYRFRTPGMANDMALRQTAGLLGTDLAQRPQTQLRALLGHPDRRVRQAAEFALVDQNAVDLLADVAAHGDTRLARLHAIWGLGVLGRRDGNALAAVPALLRDGDADVRAMAARVLGDARFADAGKDLQKALADGNSRVAREAALALARLPDGGGDAVAQKALDRLRQNDDHDNVLRLALVEALAATGARDRIHAAAGDASSAVRLGALLAEARLGDPTIAGFLGDADEQLRYEAARAIYETPIQDAMPALARLAADGKVDREAIEWRAQNACRMLGTPDDGATLVRAATDAKLPTGLRTEALAILGEWPTPHGQDRVFGNWRPCTHPGADQVVLAFAAHTDELLRDREVATATAQALGKLRLATAAPALARTVATADAGDDARIAALDALDAMQARELAATVAAIGAEAPVPLRKRAIELLSRENPARAVPLLGTLLDNATQGERQAAFRALGELQDPQATALLGKWLDGYTAGKVEPALQLDLLEAAERHPDLAKNAAERFATGGDHPCAPFLACREGGDPKEGRKVFYDNEATRCTRCHTLGGQGGNAGPVLDGIGKKLTRDQLLEALITPSARIAEGFGATTLELNDGTQRIGVVTRERDGTLTIVDASGTATEVTSAQIASRKPNATSAMPPMGGPLSRRQVRDVIAFLAQQQKE